MSENRGGLAGGLKLAAVTLQHYPLTLHQRERIVLQLQSVAEQEIRSDDSLRTDIALMLKADRPAEAPDDAAQGGAGA